MYVLAFIQGSFLDLIINGGPRLNSYLIQFAISYILSFLFVLTIRNMLRKISPENRKVNPALVFWGGLLPIVASFWLVVFIPGISRSINLEYMKRGSNPQGNATLVFGLIGLIMSCCCAALFIASNFVPFSTSLVMIDALLSLSGWTIIIIYWIRINNHRKDFKQPYTNDSLVFGISEQ